MVEAAKETAESVEHAARLTHNRIPCVGAVTWYQALDDLAQWISQKYLKDGQVSAHGQKLMEYADRLKVCHSDLALTDLNAQAIEKMIHYWEQRPFAKLANGEASDRRISMETVANMAKYLRRILIWTSNSETHPWEMQESRIKQLTRLRGRQELMTAEERKIASEGPYSWRLDELIVLYRYATSRERLYMLLGLNAGFAQSEVIHLLRSEVKGSSEPPHLRYVRNKSGKIGGAKLWPQTLRAIEQHWQVVQPAGTEERK